MIRTSRRRAHPGPVTGEAGEVVDHRAIQARSAGAERVSVVPGAPRRRSELVDCGHGRESVRGPWPNGNGERSAPVELVHGDDAIGHHRGLVPVVGDVQPGRPEFL